MLNDSIFLLYERNDKHPYPRGGLRLFPITDRKGDATSLTSRVEVSTFCWYDRDVFLNLFSDDQKKSKVYDCIFLDIDDKDLKKSLIILMAVLHKLNKNGIEHYNVIFSGSKGFHVYIPMEKIFLSNYREAVLGWLRSIDVLKHIDPSAIEPNRVTRVPSTMNSKSGMYCVPIGDENSEELMTFGKIMVLAKYPESAIRIRKITIKENKIPQLKDFDRSFRMKQEMTTDKILIGVKSRMFQKPIHYPECMKTLLDEAMGGTDLGHFERLELGKFLLHVTGGNIELVKKIYSKMSDYKEEKTTYNLNYIIRRNLKMLGCDKMIMEGICPFTSKLQAKKECPYYPSINKYISIERKKQYVAHESKSLEDFNV